MRRIVGPCTPAVHHAAVRSNGHDLVHCAPPSVLRRAGMPFEQPSANEAGLTLPPEALHAAFENPLLYWQERSQWMW